MAGLIMLMGAVVTAGIGCIMYGGYQRWFTARVLRKGIALRGTIIDRISRDRGVSSVFYTYELEGRTYSSTQRVGQKHADRLDRGKHVTVCCLPKHPARARLGGADRDTSWYTRVMIIGVFLMVLILCILPTFLTGVQNGTIH
jgi:Protein of unknown function (DUF3592)